MRQILSLLFLFAALGVQAQTREYLTVDGTRRQMLVYVPQNLPENAPLVITLHGFNQSAQYQMEHTKWNTVAESEKFIVVYPDYDGGWWDVNGTKDTKFIEKIMEDMNQRYKSDLNRVYISGFSLGAMMTYHCIEVLANKVAAFAPVSGVRFDNKAPYSPRVVPIIHTHCKGDDVFKWEGDPGHASGGYPYIPDYVKSWAEYFGMNTKPEFIDPYKASDVDLTIYKRDDSVVEVRLLSFDGAGHWHVDADGWGGVSTTWEIWNFCKRYTLNLDDVTPPSLVSLSPENGSFDLTQEHRKFVVAFDRPALNTVSAKLVGNGVTIPINNMDANDCYCASTEAYFEIPEGVEIPDGNYNLTIDGIRTEQGEFTRSYTFEYSYGYEETGDELNVTTIFSQDWDTMYQQTGESIPEGWQRVSTKSDGTTETVTSSNGAVTGACLKQFGENGDITTGFYLTAGTELQECKIVYGRVTGNLMNLPLGKYALSYNSVYWDKGSQRGKAAFDVNMTSKSNRGGYKTVVDEKGLTPKGYANANKEPITESRSHYTEFTVDKKDNYVLTFTISKPKVAVVIGNVKVTTAPSNADKYKGNFLRLMKRAKALYELTEGESEAQEGRDILKACIDKYEGFASTAPSEYEAAIEELNTAMQLLNIYATAVGNMPNGNEHPVSTTVYSADGRKLETPAKGLNIIRKTYADGKVEVKKILR